LPNLPTIVWQYVVSAAVRIDIQPAATHIACVNAQSIRSQHALQVEEDPFNALFMKVRVLAKAH
jgi:hypothetical protein